MWTLFIKNALHVKNMKRSTYGNTMCKIKATFKHNDLNNKHCSQVVTGPIQAHTSVRKIANELFQVYLHVYPLSKIHEA